MENGKVAHNNGFPDRVRFNWGFHDGSDDAERGLVRDVDANPDKMYQNGYVRGVLAWKNLGYRPASSDDAWNAFNQISYKATRKVQQCRYEVGFSRGSTISGLANVENGKVVLPDDAEAEILRRSNTPVTGAVIYLGGRKLMLEAQQDGWFVGEDLGADESLAQGKLGQQRSDVDCPVLYEVDPKSGEATGTVMPFCSVKCRDSCGGTSYGGFEKSSEGTANTKDFGYDPHCEQCGEDIKDVMHKQLGRKMVDGKDASAIRDAYLSAYKEGSVEREVRLFVLEKFDQYGLGQHPALLKFLTFANEELESSEAYAAYKKAKNAAYRMLGKARRNAPAPSGFSM